jgi:hypothetical protein
LLRHSTGHPVSNFGLFDHLHQLFEGAGGLPHLEHFLLRNLPVPYVKDVHDSHENLGSDGIGPDSVPGDLEGANGVIDDAVGCSEALADAEGHILHGTEQRLVEGTERLLAFHALVEA